jgi:hypothetical protein
MDKHQNKEISNIIPSPKTFREELHQVSLFDVKFPSHSWEVISTGQKIQILLLSPQMTNFPLERISSHLPT